MKSFFGKIIFIFIFFYFSQNAHSQYLSLEKIIEIHLADSAARVQTLLDADFRFSESQTENGERGEVSAAYYTWKRDPENNNTLHAIMVLRTPDVLSRKRGETSFVIFSGIPYLDLKNRAKALGYRFINSTNENEHAESWYENESHYFRFFSEKKDHEFVYGLIISDK